MKNSRILTGTTEASFTNRIQEKEERLSHTEDMKEEMDLSVKETVQSKKLMT